MTRDFDRYTKVIAMLIEQCNALERRDALLNRFLQIEGSMDFLAYVPQLAADVRNELKNKLSL